MTRGGENTEGPYNKEIGTRTRNAVQQDQKHKPGVSLKNNRDYKLPAKGKESGEVNIGNNSFSKLTMTQPHDPVGSFCWPKCLKDRSENLLHTPILFIYIYIFFSPYIYMLSLVLDSETQKKT